MRSVFVGLRELAGRIQSARIAGVSMEHLSMGMSNDYRNRDRRGRHDGPSGQRDLRRHDRKSANGGVQSEERMEAIPLLG